MKKLLFTLLAVAIVVFVVANGLAAGAATKRVAIVHATKGCHVWSMGAKRTPSLGVSLHRGTTVTVVNQDIDMHKLLQVSGPRITTGPFMMTNERIVLRFAKAGVYRFHTRVADMRGMPEVKTVGPDNKLVLTIRVS